MPADPTASPRRAPASRAEFRYVLGRALPFLVIVLAVLADVLTPPVERFDRFLIAAPALAAATWSARGTAAIGALAMAATALTAAVRGGNLHPALIGNEVVLAVVVLAAVVASRVRQRREAELRQISAVAEAAQSAVLRPLPPRLGSVDLRLLYETWGGAGRGAGPGAARRVGGRWGRGGAG
ncbi:serine/threonine-protein phosphatase, partial [Streptomyces sp. NPDC059762]